MIESGLSLVGMAAVFVTAGYMIGFKAGGHIERRWPRPARKAARR